MTSTTSSNSAIALSSDENSYLAEITLIVKDSFELSGQNPTKAEIVKRARVWQRVLMPVIPERDLPDAFDLAFELQESSFPINAYDIKNAYTELVSRRAEAEKKREAEMREVNRVANCPDRHHHDEDNLVEYTLGFGGETYKLPCRTCRAEAFDRRAADYKKISYAEMMEKMPRLSAAPGNGETQTAYKTLIRAKQYVRENRE